MLSGSITWECAQYFKKWQDNISKKILALGKEIENEINEEEKYVEEIIDHSINDDNVPDIENEIKEEENYVEENIEPSINDDNVPVKIKFTGVGNKKRDGRKLEDPNAIFLPDPENQTQYYCKICKFKVKRSEIFCEKYRNHRISKHMTSKMWKYFAFDAINQKFCTCSICGNNIEVNTNNKRQMTGNILKSHLISSHQIHLKTGPRLKEKGEILDADTGLMKPLPGPMNKPKLKARNEGKRKEYWQHFNSLDDPYKVSCKVCSKIVSARYSQELHYKIYKHLKEHDISLEKKYSCTYCGKCFEWSNAFLSHLKQHEKKFICKFCGRGFGSKIKQEDHENTHTGAKPHICKTCGISYAQRSNLIMHMKKH